MTLVFLPGMDGTASLFPPLPAGAIALPLPAEALSYEQLADRIEPELPSTPFVLVAESFSGPLAIELAARNPPGLRRLVLVASFALPPVPALPKPVLRLAFSLPPSTLVLRRLLLEPQSPAELLDQLVGAIRSVPGAVMVDRAQRVMQVDVRGALARVEVPIRYLRASRDRVVPATAVATIESVCPQVDVVEIDGPHLLLQTRWQACLAYLC